MASSIRTSLNARRYSYRRLSSVHSFVLRLDFVPAFPSAESSMSAPYSASLSGAEGASPKRKSPACAAFAPKLNPVSFLSMPSRAEAPSFLNNVPKIP